MCARILCIMQSIPLQTEERVEGITIKRRQTPECHGQAVIAQKEGAIVIVARSDKDRKALNARSTLI